MGQDQITQFLQQGIAAARDNRPDIARGLFQQVLTIDPRNEMAWAWLASIARDNKERLIFLKKLLEVNPQNEFALKQMHSMGIEPEMRSQSRPQAGPRSTVPYLDDARFTRAQQAVDDFLRRYTPEPVDHLRITWERRQRKRYGDRGVQRLRQVVYAVAALVFLVVAAGVIYGVMQLDLTGSGGEQRAFATRVPSQTPIMTLTPTLGGPTPTEITELVFQPTAVPDDLEPGNADMLKTPTPLYPRPNVSVERLIENALDYYSIGEYETAAEMLRDERERSDPHCYASLVYYEALSYAQLGDYARAESVLDWAQNHESPARFESCQGSPMVSLGFAEVSSLQNPASQTALSLSEQVLAADSDIVPAILIKARVQLAMGLTPDAWQTVTTALETYPEDTNLLLLAAQIELASEEPVSALSYVGQALYVDPDLLPGLYLQTEAYLLLAEQSIGESEREIQAYSLAVRSAQWLLQYYPGDPIGYFYLAKARLGEGNDDLAETALSRVLAVADDLPASVDSYIDEAYRWRGQLYFQQGRFELALADLEEYVGRVGGTVDASVIEMVITSALNTQEFTIARQRIALLLSRYPDVSAYQLWQVKVWVELCTFYPDDLTCQYDDALDEMNDTFIAGLESSRKQAEAYSYRAQARYHQIMQRSAVLSEDERQTGLAQALNDTTQALAVRESVLDHYYRGLIFEALDDPVRAYEEYQWINYWNTVYAYPFFNSDFETRFAAVAGIVRDVMAETVVTVEAPTPPPITATPAVLDETSEPENTATPQATPTARLTATPRVTVTPTPEPTAPPPVDIP